MSRARPIPKKKQQRLTEPPPVTHLLLNNALIEAHEERMRQAAVKKLAQPSVPKPKGKSPRYRQLLEDGREEQTKKDREAYPILQNTGGKSPRYSPPAPNTGGKSPRYLPPAPNTGGKFPRYPTPVQKPAGKSPVMVQQVIERRKQEEKAKEDKRIRMAKLQEARKAASEKYKADRPRPRHTQDPTKPPPSRRATVRELTPEPRTRKRKVVSSGNDNFDNVPNLIDEEAPPPAKKPRKQKSPPSSSSEGPSSSEREPDPIWMVEIIVVGGHTPLITKDIRDIDMLSADLEGTAIPNRDLVEIDREPYKSQAPLSYNDKKGDRTHNLLVLFKVSQLNYWYDNWRMFPRAGQDWLELTYTLAMPTYEKWAQIEANTREANKKRPGKQKDAQQDPLLAKRARTARLIRKEPQNPNHKIIGVANRRGNIPARIVERNINGKKECGYYVKRRVIKPGRESHEVTVHIPAKDKKEVHVKGYTRFVKEQPAKTITKVVPKKPATMYTRRTFKKVQCQGSLARTARGKNLKLDRFPKEFQETANASKINWANVPIEPGFALRQKKK